MAAMQEPRPQGGDRPRDPYEEIERLREIRERARKAREGRPSIIEWRRRPPRSAFRR